MLSHRWVTALASLGFLLTPAVAQDTGGWIIEVIGGPVTPDNPNVTVRVSAGFPARLYAFSHAGFDLLSSAPEGTFSDVHLPPPLGPPPPYGNPCVLLVPGTVLGGTVLRVGFIQIAVLGCSADPTRPLPVWEATWTTTDFSARSVRLMTTGTPYFYVYVDSENNAIDLLAHGLFEHGYANIEVRPSTCFADCDTSTGVGALDIFDFLCFMNLYAERDPIACDCDTATGPATCDIFDFLCFQSRFAAGCP